MMVMTLPNSWSVTRDGGHPHDSDQLVRFSACMRFDEPRNRSARARPSCMMRGERDAALLCVAVAQATILIANVPAMAGYGAVAYDQEKRKQGVV